MEKLHAAGDVICFSHLRWNFVFQRPNHLMSRCAGGRRVFFFEEPLPAGEGDGPLRAAEVSPNLVVVVPLRRAGQRDLDAAREALEALCSRYGIERPIAWFYTPMALEFAADLPVALTVYDCMDELSLFQGAPPALRRLEGELFARADLVFTGGRSLCKAKTGLHHAVFCFPSGVDVDHYRSARTRGQDPADQVGIPGPRLGFFGVIDERMDLELLDAVAVARPSWQLVMIGPVVKIDPATLPRRPNVHYLGPKAYGELPAYLGGWDVALMPFALNPSTRFISPTKTLEYLAGGKPVVSTPVADVVSPYAELGLVEIGRTPQEFVDAVERALESEGLGAKLPQVELLLERTSWASTWAQMARLMDLVLRKTRQSVGAPVSLDQGHYESEEAAGRRLRAPSVELAHAGSAAGSRAGSRERSKAAW